MVHNIDINNDRSFELENNEYHSYLAFDENFENENCLIIKSFLSSEYLSLYWKFYVDDYLINDQKVSNRTYLTVFFYTPDGACLLPQEVFEAI